MRDWTSSGKNHEAYGEEFFVETTKYTIYFGSEQSRRQIVEVSQAFEYAHELGMATILI